jgi:dipeptidase
MRFRFSTLLVFFLLATSTDVRPCTIIAAGKNASTDGSILISHTDTGQDSRIYVVNAQSYPDGSRAAIHWGIQDATLALRDDGEILGYMPQVSRTYQYFHSAYSHVNEHQLGIGESTIAQREELKCTRENGEQIMTIEQAQIFALQRYRKAREAVKFIGRIMTEYGFLPSSGDGAEALVIADSEEVWILEIFGVGPGWQRGSGAPGSIWAAQRLPDDAMTMIPNWSIIKEIDAADSANFLVSANYQQFAIERGWYDVDSDQPFVWQEVYSPLPVEYATGRFWLFHTTFAPNLRAWPDRSIGNNPYKGITPYFQIVEPLSIYPFSIVPEKKVAVQDIIAFQRSTFAGTIYDMTAGPEWLIHDQEKGFVKSPLATPFPTSHWRKLLKITYRRPVARHRGHYGMVLQLRSWLPAAVGGVYWVYLDNPFFSPYVPIYAGNTSIHEAYNIYDPEAFDERSARWAIDFVDNLANLRFQDVIIDVRAKRDPFEAEMFRRQEEIEAEAMRLYEQDPKEAIAFLTNYSNELLQTVPTMYRQLRNEIIVKYTNNRE